MKPIVSFALIASLAAPFALAEPDAVRIEKNIAYLGPDRAEKADLYLPAQVPAGTRCPGVVIIHGGGWTGGKKDAAREINIGTTLAEHGYVGLSINYLLADSNHANVVVWPQNLYDCKTAVRWLRKNAGRLHLDPDHIGAIGGSAGGHLAAMLGVTGPESGLDPAAPYGDFSCRVQAVVDLYGPTEWFATRDLPMFRKTRAEAPELYRQATPMTHVDKNDPPILILHGTADKTVEVAQSEKFAAALKKAGAEHQLVIVEGGPHSFHLQPKQQDLRPLVLGFFDKHLKKVKP
ncbi:MAG: alpha/beta hydrolase [Verrucomicrobia bacterium]|nr:alpha/beta hydrolase [Verrucomicrobiota bacterium]